MRRQDNGERLPWGDKAHEPVSATQEKEGQTALLWRRVAWLLDIRVRGMGRADATSSTRDVEDGVGIL